MNSARSGSGLKVGRRRRRVLIVSWISVGLPLGTKGSTELFESGGHQVEVRRMKGEKSRVVKGDKVKCNVKEGQ